MIGASRTARFGGDGDVNFGCARTGLAMRRQIRPDRRILLTENPRAESRELVLRGELISLLKCPQIGEEDPFAHLIAMTIGRRQENYFFFVS